ncbi:bifunctional trypsin-like peptidase domain-containing/SEL1-like repeat protein [Nocardia sp. XZ_19_385]|uniref:bifunctional trypsin-like peptidase domain-containing/SEL1-like repeat protein n=1 Tax=Nocardia sp. XZ_19_385 TaxID=2769488 RepID=UPI0018909F87|nr:bifunctional trypsin-like peptidase domain-containing/SEL1-like repeat protein [Nocardia sp. XZ_19_385]
MFEELLTECTVAVTTANSEGSGFFVGPALLVTAAHVVAGAERCTVTWKDIRYEAAVLDRHPDPDPDPDPGADPDNFPLPDIAVLELLTALTHPWVDFETELPRPSDRLFAIGYTRRYDKDRLCETPFSYECEGIVTMDGMDLVQLRDGLVIPGMSGAPVLNQRTGRVVGQLKRSGDTRIPTGGWVVHCRAWLDRVQVLRAEHDSAQRHDWVWRDLRARRWEPNLRPAHRTPPSGDFVPSAALAAEYALVDFTGRDQELATLNEWCYSSADFDVRLVLGAGGVGKSRLAAELCARRTEAGWIAGFLDPAAPVSLPAELRANVDPTLVVIDYAESRGDLGERLRLTAIAPAGAPLRVLLIARGASEWWDALREAPQRQVREAVLRHAPITLDSELDENPAITETAAVAAQCFARARQRPVPVLPTLPPEAAQWTVLSLHVWSLLAVLRDEDPGHRIPQPATDAALWEELLGHEARYWRSTAHRAELAQLDMTTLRRCVALMALLGTSTEHETVQALTRVPELTDSDNLLRYRIARWLRELYPAPPPEWLGRLTPDVVAEFHVVEQLCHAPNFALSALTALPAEQSTHALTVLGRAVTHRAEAKDLIRAAFHVDLGALARPAVEAARQTGPGLGRLLAEAVASESPSGTLLDELTVLVPHRSEALRDLRILLLRRQLTTAPGASMTEVLLQLSLGELLVHAKAADEAHVLAHAALKSLKSCSDEAAPGARAEAHALLGYSLHAMGHRDRAALSVNSQALELFREQLDSDSTVRPDRLAQVLVQRAHILLDIDEPLAAEHAASEALAKLAARPCDSNSWHLTKARAQVARALALWRTERHGEDLASSRAAVETLRTLASLDSDQHLAVLGIALDQLGVRLAEIGMHREAMARTREAVRIFRRLAHDNSWLYSSLLSVTLHNLAVRLGNFDRHDEALELTKEAVEIRRRAGLDASRIAHLIRSLINLAGMHERLGHRRESIDAAREAVHLGRRITAGQVTTVLLDFSDGDITVQLAEAHTGFIRDAAAALQTLAIVSHLDSPELALEATEEALELLRSQPESHVEFNRSALARVFATIGTIHVSRRDYPAAIEALTDAARIWLDLAEIAPQNHIRSASEGLSDLLVIAENWAPPTSDPATAKQAAAWLVTAARRCHALNPQGDLVVLARALRADAQRAAGAGESEYAVQVATEAVAVARAAMTTAPDTDRATTELLPRSLHTLATALMAADNRIDAIDALTECTRIGLADSLADTDFKHAMSRSLGYLGSIELVLGRNADALDHLGSALALFVDLHRTPDADLDEIRAELFETSDHCLHAAARSRRTAIAIACAVVALANSSGAPLDRMDACLQQLCEAVAADPAGTTVVCTELFGTERPYLLARNDHDSVTDLDQTQAEADSCVAYDRKFIEIAREFVAAACQVIAAGEATLAVLTPDDAPHDPLTMTVTRILLCTAGYGLQRGVLRADLERLVTHVRGSLPDEAEFDAAIAQAVSASLLVVSEDRLRVSSYLATAARRFGDMAISTPDLWSHVVELAHLEDLAKVATNAESVDHPDVAEAALRRGADLGAASATYELGWWLQQRGRTSEARVLYERAAALGVTEGILALGALLTVDGRLEEAEPLLRTAARRGHPRAMASLAGFLNAIGNESEAYTWAELAADRGDAVGMLILGQLQLAAGNLAGEDQLRTAVDRGSILALQALGEHLLTSDPIHGEGYLRRATAAGSLIAAYKLVLHILQQNHSLDEDLIRYMTELKKIVITRDGAEMLHTSKFDAMAHELRTRSKLELLNRAIENQNFDEVTKWFLRTPWDDLTVSLAGFANHVLERLDQSFDTTQLWLNLAEAGDGIAMYNVGLCYSLTEQFEEAELWWRRGVTANRVHPECYNKIGCMRMRVEDHAEAEIWFGRGAEQGDPVAMFNLGIVLHSTGRAGDAKRWFRRSHRAGHQQAAEALAKLAAERPPKAKRSKSKSRRRR